MVAFFYYARLFIMLEDQYGNILKPSEYADLMIISISVKVLNDYDDLYFHEDATTIERICIKQALITRIRNMMANNNYVLKEYLCEGKTRYRVEYDYKP